MYTYEEIRNLYDQYETAHDEVTRMLLELSGQNPVPTGDILRSVEERFGIPSLTTSEAISDYEGNGRLMDDEGNRYHVHVDPGGRVSVDRIL